MVEWLLLTVAAWIVEKALDALWKRMNATRAPLTDAQVLIHHRRRFRLALAPCVVTVLAIVLSLATGIDAATRTPVWYAGMAVLIALGIYGARVARRRWRRLQEALAGAAAR